MKVQRESFITAVAAAETAVKVTGTPMTENILLKSDGSSLLLYAGNSVSSVVKKIGVEGEKFTAAVNGEQISKIKLLPDAEEFDLTVDNDSVLIKSGRAKLKMQKIYREDIFCYSDKFADASENKCSIAEIIEAVSSVKHACSFKGMEQFKCIEFRRDKGKLRVAATDGNRISARFIETDADIEATVYSDPLKGLVRFGKDAVIDNSASNHLRIASENEVFCVAKANLKFFDISKFINPEVQFAGIDTHNVKEISKASASFSRSGVMLKLKNGELTFTAENYSDVAETDFDTKVTREALYNSDFINDAFNSFSDDTEEKMAFGLHEFLYITDADRTGIEVILPILHH